MSMVQCERCDGIFDSDNDPDCFVEEPTYASVTMPVNPPKAHHTPKYRCLCEPCREEEMERRQHEI